MNIAGMCNELEGRLEKSDEILNFVISNSIQSLQFFLIKKSLSSCLLLI